MNTDDILTDKFKVNGYQQVAYLCDGLACSNCNDDDCHHTTDINHAVNFRSINGLFIEKSEYDNVDYSDPATTNRELLLGDTYNRQEAFTIRPYPTSMIDSVVYKIDLSPNISLLRCIEHVLSSEFIKNNGTITIYGGDDYDFNDRLAYVQYENGSLEYSDIPIKWLSDTVVQAHCCRLNASMNFIFRIGTIRNETEE